MEQCGADAAAVEPARAGGFDRDFYSLLFLARGRHPIIMNKLRFEGRGRIGLRDVANLARFASRELERPLNWQVVPITRDWTDWMDSPILYLASHQAPKITESEIAKLRRFIDAGGLLFTQADGAMRRSILLCCNCRRNCCRILSGWICRRNMRFTR